MCVCLCVLSLKYESDSEGENTDPVVGKQHCVCALAHSVCILATLFVWNKKKKLNWKWNSMYSMFVTIDVKCWKRRAEFMVDWRWSEVCVHALQRFYWHFLVISTQIFHYIHSSHTFDESHTVHSRLYAIFWKQNLSFSIKIICRKISYHFPKLSIKISQTTFTFYRFDRKYVMFFYQTERNDVIKKKDTFCPYRDADT